MHAFDLCMMVCRVADAPWRMPANLEDMRAFFNYDLNPHKWREYCKRIEQYRLQYTMQVHTQTDSLQHWGLCKDTWKIQAFSRHESQSRASGMPHMYGGISSLCLCHACPARMMELLYIAA